MNRYVCKLRTIIMICLLKIKNKNRFRCGIFDVFCEKNAEITSKGNASISIGKLFLGTNGSVAAVDGTIVIKEASFSQNVTVVSRGGTIIIENGVAIGPNCCVYDHDHAFDRNGIKPGYISSQVVIEENVWLGAGVIVLKNSHIGKGSIIGAGCVVKGKIPAHSVVTTNRDLLLINEIRK